jgi:hypothetical protein
VSPRRQLAIPSNLVRPLKAYRFLRKRARTARGFTVPGMMRATGWKESSVRTYLSKHFREAISQRGKTFYIDYSFVRMSETDFLKHITQKRAVYTQYQRQKYENVITFEFLLPLTREGQLRSTLDDLFFSDTIERRLREIGLQNLEQIISRHPRMKDDTYIRKISDIVSEKFVGYSISHVSGRFRLADLMSRTEAGNLLANDERYLIDESTAVARFIVPCKSSVMTYEDDFDSMQAALCDSAVRNSEGKVEREVRLIRSLFFHLFVEAIVRTVHGEDAIWLLENGPQRRLYVWTAR